MMARDLSREKFFECACHTHKICVYTNDMDRAYDFEIVAWQQGFGSHWSLWDRVMILVRFLLNGQWPYDFVTLFPKEAKKLGKYLVNECDRLEKAGRQ